MLPKEQIKKNKASKQIVRSPGIGKHKESKQIEGLQIRKEQDKEVW